MTKIKAVIFDLDGVLVNSKEWHYRALNKALEKYGFKISEQQNAEIFDGLPTKVKLEILSEKFGLAKELHKVISEEKQIYTKDLISKECKPNLIHLDAMKKLIREGYHIALASNCIRQTVDTMLDKMELKDYFEFTLSNQDVKKPKPDPEIYLNAIKKLGLKADECLILEDNINGIQAATASGAYVMKIGSINDVTYQNIKDKIIQTEKAQII